MKATKNQNLLFYSKLKSEVSKFFKEKNKKGTLSRSFVNNKTKIWFRRLKASAPNNQITPSLFRGFVNNMDALYKADKRRDKKILKLPEGY